MQMVHWSRSVTLYFLASAMAAPDSVAPLIVVLRPRSSIDQTTLFSELAEDTQQSSCQWRCIFDLKISLHFHFHLWRRWWFGRHLSLKVGSWGNSNGGMIYGSAIVLGICERTLTHLEADCLGQLSLDRNWNYRWGYKSGSILINYFSIHHFNRRPEPVTTSRFTHIEFYIARQCHFCPRKLIYPRSFQTIFSSASVRLCLFWVVLTNKTVDKWFPFKCPHCSCMRRSWFWLIGHLSVHWILTDNPNIGSAHGYKMSRARQWQPLSPLMDGNCVLREEGEKLLRPRRSGRNSIVNRGRQNYLRQTWRRTRLAHPPLRAEFINEYNVWTCAIYRQRILAGSV